MKKKHQLRFQHILIAALALTSAAFSRSAQEAIAPLRDPISPTSTAVPLAAMSSQLEAMTKYPELGREGSPFNREFLARMRNQAAGDRAIFQNERWPVLLAEEVAAAGFPSAVAVIVRPTQRPSNGVEHALPGRSKLLGRTVTAPAEAPSVVQNAIEAANMLQDKPYRWGGGHAQLEDSGYDCSGSVSYVLRKAGLLGQAMTSRGFASYGKPGPGRWITIYSSPGHAFMTVCGLRLDTGGRMGIGESGPRWSQYPRYASGFVARHPSGY
ncbi:MAG: hypothetical protein ABIP20_19755 [Chthoniobacteraceae bacterium]